MKPIFCYTMVDGILAKVVILIWFTIAPLFVANGNHIDGLLNGRFRDRPWEHKSQEEVYKVVKE